MTRTDRRVLSNTRVRVLIGLAVMVASAVLLNMAVMAHLLTEEARGRVVAELAHERAKFEAYVNGIGDADLPRGPDAAARVLRDYIGQAVPEADEALFSVAAGRAQVRTRSEIGIRLDLDDALVAEVATARESSVRRTRVAGVSVDYAVLPLELSGSSGALVVVESAERERSRLDSTLKTLVWSTVATLVLVLGLSWWVAGRMIRPLRQLRAKADGIDETHLSERVPVLTSGGDDVAAVARTINRMLDRLELSFVGQRAFLDDVAHDLRTPLTVIRGHLDLDRPTDPAAADSHAAASQEARRMTRLIDDLLVLASASNPQFLSEGEVELVDLATGVLARATRLAPRDWYSAGVLESSVWADEQRLVQAWLELVSNAVKHTEDGQRVGIGVRASAAGGVEIFVEDTGPGVAVEDRLRIFERAVRSDSSTTRSTGLGLSIVTTIAEAHDGRARVESGPGGGARFVIELPPARVLGREGDQ